MQEHIKQMVEEINSGEAVLLDVREQQEYDEGHLNTAKLVPLSALQAGQEPPSGLDLDKNRKTYLHCRSGRRVYTAAPILEKMGFHNVIPLNEGYIDLKSEGVD